MKLSVLTDSNDLGNSVRRVVGRMFSDNVLANYLLFGVRKKENFSFLSSYHVIGNLCFDNVYVYTYNVSLLIHLLLTFIIEKKN